MANHNFGAPWSLCTTSEFVSDLNPFQANAFWISYLESDLTRVHTFFLSSIHSRIWDTASGQCLKTLIGKLVPPCAAPSDDLVCILHSRGKCVRISVEMRQNPASWMHPFQLGTTGFAKFPPVVSCRLRQALVPHWALHRAHNFLWGTNLRLDRTATVSLDL